MIQKLKEWSGVIALVAIVVLLALPKVSPSFGTAAPSGTTSFFTSVGSQYGYYVGSYGSATQIINDLGAASTTGLLVGNAGTNFTRLNGGTCYIKAYATTIAATSSTQVDCQATALVAKNGPSALSGITYGDSIVATLATSTAGTTSSGLVITGVQASSTAGYITLYISNLTGATYTWPTTGAATGTAYYLDMK